MRFHGVVCCLVSLGSWMGSGSEYKKARLSEKRAAFGKIETNKKPAESQ